MIEIEVYAENQTGAGDPIAVLSYSGKGNKVTVKTENVAVQDELTVFLQTVLSFQKQGRVAPDDRQVWMEALPEAQVSVPYWFKIAEPTSEIIEEVDDDNEEANEEEEEDEGDGPDDGESSNGGSPEDGQFLSSNG